MNEPPEGWHASATTVNPTGGVSSNLMKDQTQPTAKDGGEVDPEKMLGKLLRSVRESRGRSQQDVARAMSARGFSWLQTTVAKTEAGQRPFRVNEFISLCAVLGMDASEVISSAQSGVDARSLERSAKIRARRMDVLRAESALQAAREEVARAKDTLQRMQRRLGEAISEQVLPDKGTEKPTQAED